MKLAQLPEAILDLFFERADIHQGCEATGEIKPVFLKRWFLMLAPDASTPPRTSPRWNLTVKKPGTRRMVLLHKFMRSDLDSELHDHPWPFVSLILWRGYTEQIDAGFERYQRPGSRAKELSRKRPGFILFRRAEHRHRVLLVDGKPSWSLVVTGAKSRSWSFWPAGGGPGIPWREFLARKCGGSK